jgi:hypothetical protein
MWAMALFLALFAVVPVVLLENRAPWIVALPILVGLLLGITLEVKDDLRQANREQKTALLVAKQTSDAPRDLLTEGLVASYLAKVMAQQLQEQRHLHIARLLGQQLQRSSEFGVNWSTFLMAQQSQTSSEVPVLTRIYGSSQQFRQRSEIRSQANEATTNYGRLTLAAALMKGAGRSAQARP